MFRALSRPEQLLDLRCNFPIFRFHGAFENIDRLSFPVEQVFVKVPARRLAGFRGEFAKERVCSRTDHRCFGKHRKRDVVVHPAELRDLLVCPGLLAAEIVRWKS